ncbi:SAL1 phosphatase-like protein [Actinidia rufa]|uniref:3'(2'),5'-bisphosphate nucleotidase n=1 Tax=Actinidia rufa TaxID=165716 RepID=A0A7J0E3E3_9ERIC|nr:SAL1 phosphatase-like protein [Actinidia rufa]
MVVLPFAFKYGEEFQQVWVQDFERFYGIGKISRRSGLIRSNQGGGPIECGGINSTRIDLDNGMVCRIQAEVEIVGSVMHKKCEGGILMTLSMLEGSQAVVSFVLERELPSEPFSLVAEEDSGDLRKEETQETLHRITKLVNDTLASEGTYSATTLSAEDVLAAIDSGKSEGGPHGRHWVLDPIDGTKGFLRGDQYAIALALLDEGGKSCWGVLACPNLPLVPIVGHDQPYSHDEVGCLFFAQVGAGTDVQSLDGSPPIKVHVSAIDNPEEASLFESFEAAHSLHDLSSSIAKKLGVKAPPVRIDSQAKYGALSRGDGAIYLRFAHKGYREKIWDHAAGSIVVTGTKKKCLS